MFTLLPSAERSIETVDVAIQVYGKPLQTAVAVIAAHIQESARDDLVHRRTQTTVRCQVHGPTRFLGYPDPVLPSTFLVGLSAASMASIAYGPSGGQHATNMLGRIAFNGTCISYMTFVLSRDIGPPCWIIN